MLCKCILGNVKATFKDMDNEIEQLGLLCKHSQLKMLNFSLGY